MRGIAGWVVWGASLLTSMAGDASPAGKVTHVTGAEAVQQVQLEARKKESVFSILDVRTAEEYALGHVAGARNIDVRGADFMQRVVRLDKTRVWLVHCQSGMRSTKSLALLEKAGLKRLIHLDGGLQAWIKAGGALEK